MVKFSVYLNRRVFVMFGNVTSLESVSVPLNIYHAGQIQQTANFLFSLRKQALTFDANCLPRNGVSKPFSLRKMRKNISKCRLLKFLLSMQSADTLLLQA